MFLFQKVCFGLPSELTKFQLIYYLQPGEDSKNVKQYILICFDSFNEFYLIRILPTFHVICIIWVVIPLVTLCYPCNLIAIFAVIL
nr:unnamed protein product [Callosobruchus analis]CAI5853526.1 unnamed protein product [Callosobruchus analis]